MDITLWVVQGVVAGIFLMAGMMKFNSREKVLEKMPSMENIPGSQIKLIGLVEVLGAIGLVLPMLLNVQPILTAFAAIGLAMDMFTASTIHVKRKETAMVVMNIAIFLACAFIVYGRSGWF